MQDGPDPDRHIRSGPRGITLPFPRQEGAIADPVAALHRRLEQMAELADADRAVLSQVSPALDTTAAGADLLRDADDMPRPAFVVRGWACRARLLPDGRRQIFAFLIPGDLIGLRPGGDPITCLPTTAITRLQTISLAPLQEALRAPSGVGSGLARACQAIQNREQAELLDHVVRLGRQTAYERVAHLVLELRSRCTQAGLAVGEQFPMPLTQEVLADALGLSVVHLNRVLQQMRREGLIELRFGALTVLQPERLHAIAGYAPIAPAGTSGTARGPRPTP